MDEQQFYQVVWGRKVFADPGLEARNASEARRFFEELVEAGVPCRLQTILGETLQDSVEEAAYGN